MLTSHDTYCRCRICKPPLVGQTENRRIATMALLLVLAALIGAIIAMVRP